jgi:hypothetical protein
MFEKKYLYNKGISYRNFFVCPIKLENGYTYRCFRPQVEPESQLGSGLFTSIAEALEAGKKYLDREWQYRNELSHYEKLLETQVISKEEYQSSKCSLDQVIWGLL